MGWWEDTECEGATVGDDALDEAFEFVKRLADVYEDGLGRRPTLDDFSATLRTCLRANADSRFFEGLERRKVSAIKVKTIRIPKRQKYGVGDIVRIPLGDGRFAYGRVLKVDKRSDIVEIFRHADRGEGWRPAITYTGRLFHPICFSGAMLIREGPWEVVHSDPGFVPDDVEEQKFVIGAPGDRKMVQGGKQTPICEEAAAELEPKAFTGNPQISERIRDALKTDDGQA